jgi:fumarate reductase (CoM/CoB) subunit A
LVQIDSDVLVIGTGGAGMYAAVRAAEAGVQVIAVDKGLVSRSGATVAASGVAAVGPWHVPGDSPDVHLRDTLAGGAYLNDQPLARILVEEAPARVQELERWGLHFDREADGCYVLDQAGGHTYRRLLAVSDRVGLQIAKVLETRLIYSHVQRRSDVVITSLLVRDGRCAGALGVDLAAGELIQIGAAAVVLATGGIGQLYPATTNPVNATGNGLALQAGARLINMEQVQFYPSCLVYPPSLRGFGMGLQEYARLYNSERERFMARYEPEVMERTTRDRLSRGIYSEIMAGRGSEHGGVYLDATWLPDESFRSFMHEVELCAERGFDPRRQPVEVAPAAHYFMGGAEIDRDGQTSLPGLFAAGEAAGPVHGANRLSGNSLADILVFGARAGVGAAQHARAAGPLPVDADQVNRETARLAGLLQRGPARLQASAVIGQLHQLMWTHVGVSRRGGDLEAALENLREMRSALLPQVGISGPGLHHNRSLATYLELEGMVRVAQAVTACALARTESRGAHFREDYPARDETAPPQCTVVLRKGEELEVMSRPAQITEVEPQGEAG